MSDLQVFPIAVRGGINQSVHQASPEDYEELENFVIFRGRLAIRAPLKLIATLEDDTGTNTEVDAVLAIAEHQDKIYAATYSSAEQDVYLHSMSVDGTSVTLEGVLWTSVVSKPTVGLASFTGGTAASSEDRLYAFDYNQNFDTVYWDGTSVTTLIADLDANSTEENIPFSWMITYKFHLWGTGFYEGVANRPEMLRFSQPGLIPGTDSAGGSGSQEWFTADHRSVGRRGDKIRGLTRAGDRLVVFQKRATHAIFGSGASTWTRQELSSAVGVVGPKAVTAVDERVAYFWASDGPYRTDGSQIQYIGTPIRQLIVEVDSAEADTVVGYSPDDALVYFIVSPTGEDSYHLALAFSHRLERWVKIQWVDSGDVEIEISDMAYMDSEAAPGPEAAPVLNSVSATSDATADLSWTNGDISLTTKTHIYRSTSSGFTPSDAGNQVATVGAGETSYGDTGLSQDTEYFYQLRHFRNNQHSSASNEDSDTTWLSEPTNFALDGLSEGGIQVTGDNQATEAITDEDVGTGDGAQDTFTFTLANTPVVPGTVTITDEQSGGTVDQTVTDDGDGNLIGDVGTGNNTINYETGAVDVTFNSAPGSTNDILVDYTLGAAIVIQRRTGTGTFSTITTLNAPLVSFSYDDTSVTGGTEYFYRAQATRTGATDSEWTDTESLVAGTVSSTPEAPTSFTAQGDDDDNEAGSPTSTGIEKSEADLSWTDNADNEDSFVIERCEGAGCTDFTVIDTIGPSSGSGSTVDYADDSVIDNETTTKTYRYRVKAENAEGSSSYVGPEDATIEPQCAPSGVAIEDTSFCDITTPRAEITVWWELGDEDDLEIIRIRRETNNDGNWQLVQEWDTGVGEDPLNDPDTEGDSGSPHFGKYKYEDTGVNFDDTFNYRVDAVFNGSENVGTFESDETGAIFCTEPSC